MAKQLEKDMMRMMSVTERFKYQNDLKRMKFNMSDANKKMQHNIDTSNTTCSYSGLPSMEVYQDEPEASLEEQAKHTDWEDEWVDRDESEWDSSSDGGDKRGSDSYDDSNEY